MKKFTAIDTKTGRVLYGGTAQTPEALESSDVSIVTDEAHTDGWFSEGKHYPLPPQPSTNHTFDYSVKQWIDPHTLQDLKDAKWELVKERRTRAIDAPLVTPYGVFDCDSEARTSITDAVLMLQTQASAGVEGTITFTLYDNSTVVLTTAQMVEVGLLMGAQKQEAFASARTLRDSIEAATTIEELNAIEVN